MVKIGMLSFAHVHANGYARQVNENERAQLVAIWDHIESRGKSAAEQYKVPFYSDLGKILDLDIDAVVVNVETSRGSETPRGKACSSCYRYINSWCVGCPLTADYKNPLLE